MRRLKKHLNAKNWALFVSVLFLTLYLPLCFTVYFPTWYTFNYVGQGTYDTVTPYVADYATGNLVKFFLYMEDLNILWTPGEALHMFDVRIIYTCLFIFAVLAMICVFKFFDEDLVIKFSKWNLFIIPFGLLVLPFFKFFWTTIFHPLLFRNNLWQMSPNDLSYTLFPNSFFINSIIFIVFTAMIENLFIWFKFSKYSHAIDDYIHGRKKVAIGEKKKVVKKKTTKKKTKHLK